MARPTPVQLLPVFRSPAQAAILARLLLGGSEHSVTDLARFAEVSKPSAAAEVDRLETAGIVRSRRLGSTRLVSAAVGGPVRSALETLVLYAVGPVVVVAEELSQVPGVERAFLFGSWAERYLRTPGAPPKDIDLLVVGTPDRDDVEDAADRARERLGLGLDVNATVVSEAAWDAAASPFLAHVQAGPLVPLRLHEDGAR